MKRRGYGNIDRVRRIALIAAVAAGIALTAPAGAAAACPSGPVLPYDSGGPARSGSPNDPLFDRQWGLTQIHAPQAWAAGATGSGTTIAIVDTGVDLRHPDLASKSLPGIDLVANDACGQDEEGHGTHVAGIAAAKTDNGIGVAGVAPDAKILPVRVLDAEGSGDDERVGQGIRKAADNGAQVINLSLGGDPVIGELPMLNETLEAAVEYAWSKGSVIVAAAGNESVPLCSYPAAAPHAICVAANDRRGAPASYSNLPAGGTALAVRAPGGAGSPFCEDDEDVWSTVWPASQYDATCEPGGIRGYETLAGTSMASPHVAGVAALLVQKGLSNGQVLECLRTTSSNGGSYDPVQGYGTVNAEAAVKTCSKETTPTGPSGSGPPPAGGSGADRRGPVIRLRVRRLTRRGLIRKKRFSVETTSNEAAKVVLSASLRGATRASAAKTTRLSRRSVSFSRAGTKRVVLRITRRGLRALRRARGRQVVLLSWRATDRAGNSSRGRVRIPLRTR
jgi:serine protease